MIPAQELSLDLIPLIDAALRKNPDLTSELISVSECRIYAPGTMLDL